MQEKLEKESSVAFKVLLETRVSNFTLTYFRQLQLYTESIFKSNYAA